MRNLLAKTVITEGDAENEEEQTKEDNDKEIVAKMVLKEDLALIISDPLGRYVTSSALHPRATLEMRIQFYDG